MIDRRAFIQAAALAALSAPLAAGAEPGRGRRVPRIGVLGEVSPVPWTVKTALAEIECRWSGGEHHRLPILARELVERDVDLMLTIGPGATRAARNVSRALPIVFVTGSDPVADGLVASATRPGGNVTGLVAPSAADLAVRSLGILRCAVPGLAGVAVLSNPDSPASGQALRELHRWAVRQPAGIRSFGARSADEIDQAVPIMRAQGADGLLVLPDALFAIHASRLVALAAEHRLPAFYGARAFAEAGGLIAMWGDTADLIRRTATLVGRVLAGAMPAAVPVEFLTRVELAVNLGTASALGLALPPHLLAQATTTISA